MKYDHKKIESKWQKIWERKKSFTAKDFDPSISSGQARPKYYVLVEFPYPSGEGLHTGHVRSYAAMDVIARKRRMEGYNVLYPMGWDAFGLPTERHAIQTGTSPQVATKKDTDNFRRQMKSLGLSFDWSREINTTDPKYYKWTQWIFLQLFKHGLAYKAKTEINWCPSCKIGLANEEAAGGRCDRCGSPVEKREKEQWMLKITAYADKLLHGLKEVDFLPEIKKQQENWIGRSEGAEIDFLLNWKSPEMDLVFATNNQGKLKRMRKLFAAAGLRITLKTPAEIGITGFDVIEDGKTLAENSEKKARAVAEHTDLPVFADDSGFFIDGVEIDPVAVKRNALAGVDEKSLTIEEIGKRMEKYYQKIAASHGGRKDAEWRNALCFITPEKIAVHAEVVRPVILTDEPHGKADPYLPLRSLYISKATGKYVLEQIEEEEMKELQPITEGLKKLFTPAIRVFTTRPDTVFGATYMALAPEHPFVGACIKRNAFTNTKEVKRYIEAVGKERGSERAEKDEKSGIELKGVRAINPATKEEIPIWVADYVMGDVGTGAIMAVPAHDERDFEFAKKYDLPIREVIEPLFRQDSGFDAVQKEKPLIERNTVTAILKHWEEDRYLCLRWKNQDWRTFVIGGTDGEAVEVAAIREIKEETGYQNIRFMRKVGDILHAQFFAAHKGENRWAHIQPVYCELINGEQKDLDEHEKKLHELVWLTKREVANFLKKDEMSFAWQIFLDENAVYVSEGILANSGKFSGMDSEKAKWEITKFVGGERKVQYKLRDWVFSRQRYWGEPIPLIFCENCKKLAGNPKSEARNPKRFENSDLEIVSNFDIRVSGVSAGERLNPGWIPVPEKDLPVELPKVKNYKPRDDGQSPLASVTKWVNVKCPKCKGPAKRETDVMPNWAGSSWYYLAYALGNQKPKTKNQKYWNADLLKYWLPVNWYNGGMEHVTLHLLYSRFWNQFLYDIGVVPVKEPYKKRTAHGLVLAEGGVKMSKSKGNVVNPDTLVKEFGADALRLYEMFIGPFDQAVVWDPRGIVGTYRFLERIWKLGTSQITSLHSQVYKDVDLEKLLNKTIKKVGEDIESMSFNTAISAMMIFVNNCSAREEISAEIWGRFLKFLAPFAPHVAEELWSILGNKKSIQKERWPSYDPKLIEEDTFELVIQINGKVRDKISVQKNISKSEAEKMVLASEKVKSALGDAKPKKVIFVPGRLINFVA